MIDAATFRQCVTCLLLTASTVSALGGCSAVPRRFTWIAEPGVTLTMLSTDLQPHVGKVVILGGTITEEEDNEPYLLLCLKNRPLDQDYKPHRPPDASGPEAGSYWVRVPKRQLPSQYRNWGRATIVGRVTGERRFKTEPILTLLYMRGWSASGKHDGVWENVNPNYVPSVPGGIDVKD